MAPPPDDHDCGWKKYAEAQAAELALLVDLVVADRLTPQIGLRVDWTQANDAALQLMDRQVAGKAVLIVSADD